MGYDLGWIDKVYAWMVWFFGEDFEVSSPHEEVITVFSLFFVALFFLAAFVMLTWVVVIMIRM